METQEVADTIGVSLITVRKWALHNGVSFSGSGRRKTYQWTDEDVARFKAREKKRGPKGKRAPSLAEKAKG